jgi:hypothetical protein
VDQQSEAPQWLALGSKEDLVLSFGALDQAEVALTDERLVVAVAGRIRLDCQFSDIRRIQLDVEQGLPATVVVVPARPSVDPQLLRVPLDELDHASRAVGFVGARMGPFGPRGVRRGRVDGVDARDGNTGSIPS